MFITTQRKLKATPVKLPDSYGDIKRTKGKFKFLGQNLTNPRSLYRLAFHAFVISAAMHNGFANSAYASSLADFIINGPSSTPAVVVNSSAQQLKAPARAPNIKKTFNALSTKSLRVSDAAKERIKKVEILRLNAYNDTGDPAGTWTIGYGHTIALPDGRPVQKGLTITKSEAQTLLDYDLELISKVIRNNLKAPVTQNMFDVLVDTGFNKGPGAVVKMMTKAGLSKQSTSAPDYEQMAREFSKYVHVKKTLDDGTITKVKHAGLLARAQENSKIFLSDMPSDQSAYMNSLKQNIQNQADYKPLLASLTPITTKHISAGLTGLQEITTHNMATLQKAVDRFNINRVGLTMAENDLKSSANLLVSKINQFSSSELSSSELATLSDLNRQLQINETKIKGIQSEKAQANAQYEAMRSAQKGLNDLSVALYNGTSEDILQNLLALQTSDMAGLDVRLVSNIDLNALASIEKMLDHHESKEDLVAVAINQLAMK